MAKKKPQLAKSEVVEELPVACASEPAAVEWFEKKRWGDCPCCPHCGDTDVYPMKDRATGGRNKDFRWRCRGCGKLYSVRTGTVYEESLIPMHKWARALWEAGAAKNGISALELSRKLQVGYRSALFVMARIRHCMAHDPNTDPKLTGTIEADETYVGGKPRYRQAAQAHETGPIGRFSKLPLVTKSAKRVNADRCGRSLKYKTPVFAAVQRGGEVRTRVIPNVTAANLRAALADHSEPSESVLMTDDFPSYKAVGGPFSGHEIIRHSCKEYVRGDVHTNTIEGFFSRVKRQLNGTYHAVSKEHLHRYISHAEFLYNTRQLTDGDRTLDLVKRTEGKRLMYREPVRKSA